jgi:16S rRNA (adenine1518-N6/adenine1519-N6)-dimethyltransferase
MVLRLFFCMTAPEYVASPSALLRRYGLRPRKRFSQSFLVDRRLPEQIVRAAEISGSDEILEIGPGLGILTCPLAEAASRVVAVELDRDLAGILPSIVPENVVILSQDALAFQPVEHFSGPYKLVANLPYQITTAVLLRYLDIQPRAALMVVMVQKEVAERITASPGRLSYLAVAIQSVAAVRMVRVVPPGAFYPPPKVQSAVLRLDPLPASLIGGEHRPRFLEVVQAGFAQPRKQLANSLAQGLRVGKSEALLVLERARLAPDRRPQELTLQDWLRLYDAVTSSESRDGQLARQTDQTMARDDVV